MAYHVSKARFAALVEQALAELPDQFAEFLEEVPVEVMDRPTRRQLRQAGLGPDGSLLGLYCGRGLIERGARYSAGTHDECPLEVIYIFQEDIEAVCRTEADLVREIRITVLHEIGHHFGMDEDDLERLGYQ